MAEQNAFEILTEKFTNWGGDFVDILPYLLVALLVQAIFIIIGKISKKVSFKILNKFHSSLAVSKLVGNVILINMIIAGFVVALSVLKLDRTVTSLLAGAGIIGLALGLAFQDLVLNIISGVLIAVRKPFNIGDFIETREIFGRVLDIRLRTVEIENRQGQIIFIPSREVLQSHLKNYTAMGKRRISVDVGVSYGEDLERVKEITINAIKSIPEYLTNEPLELYYKEFADSSIVFMVRFWIKFEFQWQYRKAVSDAIIAIRKAYDEHDITIPFPIRTVDFGIKGGQPLDETTINFKKLD